MHNLLPAKTMERGKRGKKNKNLVEPVSGLPQKMIEFEVQEPPPAAILQGLTSFRDDQEKGSSDERMVDNIAEIYARNHNLPYERVTPKDS